MVYTIWTTGACNLRCKYCYEGINKPNQHMTSTVADEALNFIIKDFNLNNSDELILNFHGGEPFLNFDILKFFVRKLKQHYAEKCKMVLTATTNATVLDKEMLDFIMSENMDITVSLDGEKNIHDKMRPFINGQGSHDIAMKNSLILLERFPNIRVRMTFTPESVHQLSENVKYLLEQGFLTIAPGIDTFDTNWDEDHVDALEKQILIMKELLKNYPEACIGLCEKLKYCGKICKGGINSKHIYFDGSIYPCMITGGHEEFKIGTVFGGIEHNKHQTLLAHSEYNNEVCDGCDLDVFCTGARCKILNKLTTGDYDMPPNITCSMTNLLYTLNGISSLVTS